MPLFETNPVGLSNFVRVTNTEPFIEIFDYLYSIQSEVLYAHSKIYPFAYLNLGRMQLYLNKDFRQDKIIPIVRKNEQRLLEDKISEQKPQYSLYTPHCGIDDILATLEHLQQFSSIPVDITDVTKAYADKFLSQVNGWEKTKTSDDVIQQAGLLAKLEGRNFSSLRNTLKHVRNDLKPETQALNSRNAQDAICVFERWKATQGLKYFRVTVGRDVRLIEEYADKMDFQDFFGYVHYINNVPKAVSFGCRSAQEPTWGVDVTCKADPASKGLADFAFVHLMTEMNKKGIVYVNDSGGTGKVLLNKKKFHPLKSIPMYDLQRKESK